MASIPENTDMKYVIVTAFAFVTWLLINELVFKDKGGDKPNSLLVRLKDLGARFHVAIGVLALLIIIYFVARFLFRMAELP